MPRTSPTGVLIVAILLTSPGWSRGEMDFRPRPIDRLPAADLSLRNPAQKQLPPGYSHVVLVAWPRLAPEQAEKTPGTAAKFAQMFGSVILAGVEQDPATGRHRLARVGIGHIVRGEGSARIIRPGDGGLSFIGSQVLSSGEKELDKIQVIARYDTAVLLESPAVLLRGGVHRAMRVRHFIWTSAAQGGLASVVWAVDDQGPAGPQVVDQQFVQLLSDSTDDRLLSVDPTQFSFIGAPGPTAFAMARLPAGAQLAASPELLRLATTPRYDQQTLPLLAQALAAAVAGQ
ncbi:hypothetical protein Pla123a_25330 [Posidoniimonas polymericola]|uniref:Uncharacterized protein n=1 Tax=Posidoniimonas polymericola TaxID=2528002 RepID=A0A5C5YQG2_9BACT|nr:hypothetical protein [Posidoniimonas polymericola]TWT77103.1 hypothetical protein Pla123a_25330 [Posidoniimonas polymericola]